MTGAKAKSGIFYGYVIIAASFFIWLAGYGSTATFSVFLKPLSAEFGWGRAEIALAYAISVIVQAFVTIGIGWLTDKLGPQLVVMVFGSFVGIGYLLASRVTALWQFQIDYAIVLAIGISVVGIPGMATVSRWFTKKRTLMIGIVQSGGSIGGLIFAPLMAWLILDYGWRFAYIIMGIIMLVGILLPGIFLRRDPRAMDIPAYVSSEMVVPEKETQEHLQNRGHSLWQAINTSQFWMIAGLNLILGFYRTTFQAHTAAHVQDLGFSLADGANVVAVMLGATLLGRIGLGKIADVIGTRQAYIISFLASGASLIWLVTTRDLWGLNLFALVFGFSWGSQAVLRFALASETFGLASLGLVFGALSMAEAISGSLGSYFGGYIFDTFGSYQPIFWIGIALSIMGMILAWRLKPIIKRS